MSDSPSGKISFNAICMGVSLDLLPREISKQLAWPFSQVGYKVNLLWAKFHRKIRRPYNNANLYGMKSSRIKPYIWLEPTCCSWQNESNEYSPSKVTCWSSSPLQYNRHSHYSLSNILLLVSKISQKITAYHWIFRYESEADTIIFWSCRINMKTSSDVEMGECRNSLT